MPCFDFLLLFIVLRFIFTLMSSIKKLSKQESVAKPDTKKPKTNSQLTSNLLTNINEQVFKQVSLGKISFSPVKTVLPTKTEANNPSNPEDHLQNVELNLKAIRNSIIQQKKAEKEQERTRLIKAQELIEKIKKEKSQYQLRLKQKNDKSIIERRLYSDTTLNQMRAKLQERIANKRQEIEQRVKAIQERKLKRDERLAGQQNQYWLNIKEVKQKAKSSSRLPSLMNNQGRDSNLSLPRKNSQKQLSLMVKAPNQQDFLRWKQENSKLKPIQQRNHGILQKLKGSHKTLSRRLHAQEVILNEFLPKNNKHKLMGDQFLKESLLIAKKSRVTNAEEQAQLRESMQVEAHEAELNRNEKVERMREKWERMLSKIRYNEIAKEQGLDLLNNIEKRLDKMDLPGVKQRLKLKYEIFDQLDL